MVDGKKNIIFLCLLKDPSLPVIRMLFPVKFWTAHCISKICQTTTRPITEYNRKLRHDSCLCMPSGTLSTWSGGLHDINPNLQVWICGQYSIVTLVGHIEAPPLVFSYGVGHNWLAFGCPLQSDLIPEYSHLV